MRMDVRADSARVLAAGLTVVGLVVAGAPGVAQAADAPTYLRASVKTGGGQPTTLLQGTSDALSYYETSVSDDGRYTVFTSNAEDLVPGDTNSSRDIFLRDSVGDVTTRINVSSSGEQAAGRFRDKGSAPSMSADGRYIAFQSWAENLVPGDTNGVSDIFLRDVVAGVTTRVSLTANGQQSLGSSEGPAISPDGRFIAFKSHGQLVAGDTNSEDDVYLREVATGHTVRITETYDGKSIRFPLLNGYLTVTGVTSGGRHVVFETTAENLVPGDTNGELDVYVRDVAAGATIRASVTDSETEINKFSNQSSMSADGRYVAFTSSAGNIEPGTAGRPQVYVRDLVRSTTTRVTVLAGDLSDEYYFSVSPSISADGRQVAFGVFFNTGRDDIFLRDLDARTTRLVTVSPTGGALNGQSYLPKLSANGDHLVFRSEASNVVDGDTNDNEDVFVRLNVH